MITTPEKADVIATGIRHIGDPTGSAAFGGRDSAGPLHRMTDDCDAEELALESVRPTCSRRLCTFHVGQAAWRWLREPRERREEREKRHEEEREERRMEEREERRMEEREKRRMEEREKRRMEEREERRMEEREERRMEEREETHGGA